MFQIWKHCRTKIKAKENSLHEFTNDVIKTRHSINQCRESVMESVWELRTNGKVTRPRSVWTEVQTKQDGDGRIASGINESRQA